MSRDEAGAGVTQMNDLNLRSKLQYGVATVWRNKEDEQVSICGTLESALKYQRKVQGREEPPLVADIVHRDVLLVYGPWTDTDSG